MQVGQIGTSSSAYSYTYLPVLKVSMYVSDTLTACI